MGEAVRPFEIRGFYVYLGITIALLLFFRFYRGQIAIDRQTGKIVGFSEKRAVS